MAAALTAAYENGGGGAIGDCSITDFGVRSCATTIMISRISSVSSFGTRFGKKAKGTPQTGPGAPAAGQDAAEAADVV